MKNLQLQGELVSSQQMFTIINCIRNAEEQKLVSTKQKSQVNYKISKTKKANKSNQMKMINNQTNKLKVPLLEYRSRKRRVKCSQTNTVIPYQQLQAVITRKTEYKKE